VRSRRGRTMTIHAVIGRNARAGGRPLPLFDITNP
jgi:hypothetical protein